MYGNIDSGYIRFAPSRLTVGDSIVYNPTEGQYRSQGWKPCVFADEPETEHGYHAEEKWTDEGDEIVQSWEIVQDNPNAEIDNDELAYILLGGDGT